METRCLTSKSSTRILETSDDSFEYTDDNIVAKIKRLQIEENYIFQSLRKSINMHGVCLVNDFSYNSDYHKFKTNIKDAIRSVKNLLDYVNANTSNEDAIKTVDVDHIKMAVLELEHKIKSLKKYLHLELVNLKHTEEEAIHNINENPARFYKIKGREKIHSATYNHIVPSPVKEIINSSFKCLEVQEFQEFMANSENRYGGWNEYYHNIFIKFWNKYFKADCNIDLERYMTNVMNSDSFKLLIHDLLEKLPDFTKDNIILHCQWYIKFTYLKERQTLAIEKWREKKLLIKNKVMEGKEKQAAQKFTNYQSRGYSVADNTSNLFLSHDSEIERSDDGCLYKDMNAENIILIKSTGHQNRLPFAYTKPTKQWLSRCQSTEHPEQCHNIAVNLKKLKIPKWRLGLPNV